VNKFLERKRKKNTRASSVGGKGGGKSSTAEEEVGKKLSPTKCPLQKKGGEGRKRRRRPKRGNGGISRHTKEGNEKFEPAWDEPSERKKIAIRQGRQGRNQSNQKRKNDTTRKGHEKGGRKIYLGGGRTTAVLSAPGEGGKKKGPIPSMGQESAVPGHEKRDGYLDLRGNEKHRISTRRGFHLSTGDNLSGKKGDRK